jgi:hypothetical protein
MRPAYYFSILFLMASLALPLVLAARRVRWTRAVVVGWALLVVADRATATLGYLYPAAFGFNRSDVKSPDAPDLIAVALIAAVASGLSATGGLVLSRFLPHTRKDPTTPD